MLHHQQGDAVPDLTFKYAVATLLEKIKENRKAHVELYEKAMQGYREQLAERLIEIAEYAQTRATAIQTTDTLQVSGNKLSIHDLDEPKEYTKYYDEAIEMLEMTTEEEIELPQTHFRQLIRDQWDWKERFYAGSMKYVG